MAVSYTHLELLLVQKTLLLHARHIEHVQLGHRLLERAGFAERDAGELLHLLEHVVPVSYTHLDVYKRQAETLAHHRLDLGVVRQDERHAALGHPFGAGVGVVVEADAGVEGQPARDVLAEIDIARHLVHRLVGGGLVGVAVEERVPRLAAEVLVVHPDGQAVAPEERGALKPRHAQHLVARVEPVVERLLARRVAVVDAVAAPVVEEAQRAGGGAVVVAQGEGCLLYTSRCV